jgi:hypothetical protein
MKPDEPKKPEPAPMDGIRVGAHLISMKQIRESLAAEEMRTRGCTYDHAMKILGIGSAAVQIRAYRMLKKLPEK